MSSQRRPVRIQYKWVNKAWFFVTLNSQAFLYTHTPRHKPSRTHTQFEGDVLSIKCHWSCEVNEPLSRESLLTRFSVLLTPLCVWLCVSVWERHLRYEKIILRRSMYVCVYMCAFVCAIWTAWMVEKKCTRYAIHRHASNISITAVSLQPVAVMRSVYSIRANPEPSLQDICLYLSTGSSFSISLSDFTSTFNLQKPQKGVLPLH